MAGVGQLAAAVRTLPMMVPRRVVLVLQAENLLAPKRESEAAAKALADLETLLENPEAQTTLVFVAGTLDRRSRMFKLLTKHATLVECGVIEDKAAAERWIRNRVAAAGAEIHQPAAALLAERGGTDVKRLRNEVDRLLLYALGQKTITVEDARQIAGPVVLEDDWAMTNAIEAGDAAVALRQLALMLDEGVASEKVLGQLAWLVRAKLSAQAPAALAGAVDAVFRTSTQSSRRSADASERHRRVVPRRRAVPPGLDYRAEMRLRRDLASGRVAVDDAPCSPSGR